jgi:hypothetical protein
VNDEAAIGVGGAFAERLIIRASSGSADCDKLLKSWARGMRQRQVPARELTSWRVGFSFAFSDLFILSHSPRWLCKFEGSPVEMVFCQWQSF